MSAGREFVWGSERALYDRCVTMEHHELLGKIGPVADAYGEGYMRPEEPWHGHAAYRPAWQAGVDRRRGKVPGGGGLVGQ